MSVKVKILITEVQISAFLTIFLTSSWSSKLLSLTSEGVGGTVYLWEKICFIAQNINTALCCVIDSAWDVARNSRSVTIQRAESEDKGRFL